MADENPAILINATRRRVLQMIAAGGAATLGGYSLWVISTAETLSVGGYGIDPNLFSPTVTWGKSLAPEQLVALRILSDIVIPADEYSPKASDLDIADFLNEWVSAPYPEQQEDRNTLLNGLRYLDRQAGSFGAENFACLEAHKQSMLFDRLAAAVAQGAAVTRLARFFERLVYLVVGAFYTTRQGLADIGYVGNKPMTRFDGPPAEIRRHLGL